MRTSNDGGQERMTQQESTTRGPWATKTGRQRNKQLAREIFVCRGGILFYKWRLDEQQGTLGDSSLCQTGGATAGRQICGWLPSCQVTLLLQIQMQHVVHYSNITSEGRALL